MSSSEGLQGTIASAAPSGAERRMLAVGQVYLWQGGSLWIGRGHGRSDWHDHHALQIAVALDGVCRFRGQADGAWAEFRGAIVRSHRPHQFEVEGATMAQLFIEPETVEGRRLRERFVDDISPLPEAPRRAMARLLGDALRAGVQADPMIAAARAATLLLAGVTAPSAEGDDRIDKAIAHIRARIDAPIMLGEAAAAAALSPGRFRHLFVAQTGTSFRAYVLWTRLNVAIQFAMAGRSWTEAAHAAGFADSAHLTRTFRRMFGMNPAALVPGQPQQQRWRAGATAAPLVARGPSSRTGV
jgi:AraC family transcriptional regulator